MKKNSILPWTITILCAGSSSLFSFSAYAQTSSIRVELQKQEARYAIQKSDEEKRNFKSRCYLGLVQNTDPDWTRCQGLSVEWKSIPNSERARMESFARKDLESSDKKIKDLDQRLVKLQNELKKTDTRLEADHRFEQKQQELREAASEIPSNIKGEDRTKLLKSQHEELKNAAREKFKATDVEIKQKLTDTSDKYAPCVTAITTYSATSPKTDFKTPCYSISPADSDWATALLFDSAGSSARDHILDHVTKKRDAELTALKSQQEKEYANMLAYADKNEDCGNSKMAGSSWACQAAHKTAEYGTLATVAAQQVAGIVLQTDVNRNLQHLNGQSVTSDVFETAAKNSDSIADHYGTLKNVTHGVAASQAAAGLTAIIVGATDPNLKQEAAEEHTTAGMKAFMAGVATEATAQSFRIQEKVARDTAAANRKVRDGYKGIEDLKIGQNPDPLADRGTETQFAGLPSDSTSTQSAAQKDGMTPEEYSSVNLDTPPPSLGNPLNTGGNGGGSGGGGFNPPPAAPGNIAAAPSAGGGGFFGGGGGGGSGGGSALQPSQEETSGTAAHQYAGMMNNPSRYSTGGSGGSGSAGGSGSKGVDLSGMLAKFLPGFGADKDTLKAGKGIAAYGKRSIAGGEKAGEYDQDLNQIDRSKSLFDRVHTAYQSSFK